MREFGAIAGSRFGIQGIPSRWATYLNGVVTQPNGSEEFYNSHSIQDLAHKLIMRKIKPETQLEPIIEPKMVHDLGVWASNLPGAAASDTSMAPVSMCRTCSCIVTVAEAEPDSSSRPGI